MNDWVPVLAIIGTQLVTTLSIFMHVDKRIDRLDNKLDKLTDIYIRHLEQHHG